MEKILMRVVFSKEFPGLGKRIRQERKRAGSDKSLTELAAAAGISVPHWNRIENEKVRYLPLETLRGIEIALGVDLGIQCDQ